MENSGVTTRSAPNRAPSARARRMPARLCTTWPSCGLSCARAIFKVSDMSENWGRDGSGSIRRALPACAVIAQQEFAADLDHRHSVVFDDVGGSVGFRPVLGQE